MYHEFLFNELYFFGTNRQEVRKNVIQKPYIIPLEPKYSEQSKNFLSCTIKKVVSERISGIELKNHELFDCFRPVSSSKIFSNTMKVLSNDTIDNDFIDDSQKDLSTIE